MAARIPETFAPGSGSAVADALEPAIAKAKELEAQGVEGPWGQVGEVLRALDFALRTRSVAACLELGKKAEELYAKMFVAAGQDDVVGNFLLDLLNPGRRPAHERLVTIADFLGTRSNSTSVPLEVYRGALMLEHLVPELAWKHKANDVGAFRPFLFSLGEVQRETMLNAIDKGFAELPAKTRNALGRLMTKSVKLPKRGDGRGIVRTAARYLGLDDDKARNLFGKETSKRWRCRDVLTT